MWKSKKAIVYFVAVIAMGVVTFCGLDPVLAHEFVGQLALVTSAYLAGQGIADVGKHAGQALDAGRALARSAGEHSPSASEAAEVATAAAEVAEKVDDAVRGDGEG